ncbi:hypothetical protein CHUAL_010570 [Chamberlinius hualienensis]
MSKVEIESNLHEPPSEEMHKPRFCSRKVFFITIAIAMICIVFFLIGWLVLVLAFNPEECQSTNNDEPGCGNNSITYSSVQSFNSEDNKDSNLTETHNGSSLTPISDKANIPIDESKLEYSNTSEFSEPSDGGFVIDADFKNDDDRKKNSGDNNHHKMVEIDSPSEAPQVPAIGNSKVISIFHKNNMSIVVIEIARINGDSDEPSSETIQNRNRFWIQIFNAVMTLIGISLVFASSLNRIQRFWPFLQVSSLFHTNKMSIVQIENDLKELPPEKLEKDTGICNKKCALSILELVMIGIFIFLIGWLIVTVTANSAECHDCQNSRLYNFKSESNLPDLKLNRQWNSDSDIYYKPNYDFDLKSIPRNYHYSSNSHIPKSNSRVRSHTRNG